MLKFFKTLFILKILSCTLLYHFQSLKLFLNIINSCIMCLIIPLSEILINLSLLSIVSAGCTHGIFFSLCVLGFLSMEFYFLEPYL